MLSIVEGVTEFLPVSSTGHLVLTARLLNIPQTEFVKSFEIIIQLGAILAIVLLYWRSLFTERKVWERVFVAFIPTAVIGFTLYKFIKQYLIGNELVTLGALFVGGVLLIVLEKLHKQSDQSRSRVRDLTIRQSFLIGVIQAISVVPGVSRSAASILGGMYLGADRKTAVEFSFLLAVPTMVAATGLDLVQTRFSFSSLEWVQLGVGFIGAFITALIVVKWFVKFVQKNTFVPFGIYRMILSLIYFVLIYF